MSETLPPTAGGIDCDIHPGVPEMKALLPYLDDYWRENFVLRGIDRINFDMTSYPPSAPLSGRPDWRPVKGIPGSDFALMQRDALDRFGTRFAICNPIHGAQAMFNDDMAAMMCRAVNDWLAKEWLDREPRLRASIMVPAQNVELAVDEIERLAGDPRFVQVLLLVMGDMPLGKRRYWPIYAAAARHGLPIGIHAGSSYRHAPTPIGWPSYLLADYVSYANGFESALLSLIAEGVFSKFPTLKVVLIESGFTWLPGFLWRVNKTWRGSRTEIPWVDRPPGEIVRDHVRLTIQPVDAPPEAGQLERLIDQLGSDRLLLFSTDYPHWQFDGDAVLPSAFSGDLLRRVLVDNPHETYPRLTEVPPRMKESA
jgi:uncharacterized protein